MRPLHIERLRRIAEQLQEMAAIEEATLDFDAAESVRNVAIHLEAIADVAHEMESRGIVKFPRVAGGPDRAA